MNQQMQPSPQGGGGDTPGKALGIASLVMGILALVIDGLIFGTLGIIFACLSKKEGFTGGMATAGLVMSIVGLALSIVIYAICGPVICSMLGL